MFFTGVPEKPNNIQLQKHTIQYHNSHFTKLSSVGTARHKFSYLFHTIKYWKYPLITPIDYLQTKFTHSLSHLTSQLPNSQKIKTMSHFQKFQSTFFFILLSLALMLTYVTNAQMMAPSPASSLSSECVNAVFNLTDCLTYVEAGSNTTKPDKPCCPELAGLIDSNPICLCELLGGAAESYGISVDNKRALALPKICHISTPPLSTCAG